MALRGIQVLLIAAVVWTFAGCTQTSRVDDNLTTSSLTQTRKAVAVMRVGAASPACVNVAVLLGVREGQGFRRHQGARDRARIVRAGAAARERARDEVLRLRDGQRRHGAAPLRRCGRAW